LNSALCGEQQKKNYKKRNKQIGQSIRIRISFLFFSIRLIFSWIDHT